MEMLMEVIIERSLKILDWNRNKNNIRIIIKSIY